MITALVIAAFCILSFMSAALLGIALGEHGNLRTAEQKRENDMWATICFSSAVICQIAALFVRYG